MTGRMGEQEGTMDREYVHNAVEALWLKYKGLTIESNRAWNRMDNAAYKTGTPTSSGDLPGGAFMVAN
ncbi:MAG: hypothetical protein A4E34_02261 [Methanoregula sp. PtaU1.Bin006]|uniref:hypothetical protein n=1 Tax=Methanoregula sp. PtaU1.Bin006 TaxID=1811681 RepID=UPI0009CF4FFF|nr:hypothetical protein [Methanoregula sp. PtaU1.Bin006]OPY32884.1 MAG: hypothetical protein A4E34_02261 [Methanoregula sp. PtaU1.Bin006]